VLDHPVDSHHGDLCVLAFADVVDVVWMRRQWSRPRDVDLLTITKHLDGSDSDRESPKKAGPLDRRNGAV
jgi:hypothetical protein